MEKVGDFPREAILLTRASEAQAAALEQKARDARVDTIKVHIKSPQMRLTLDDCVCFAFALSSLVADALASCVNALCACVFRP